MKNLQDYEQFINEYANPERTPVEAILAEYGFMQSSPSNEWVKTNKYKAIIWKDQKVTICSYTSGYGRFLDSITYETFEKLEKELQKNHY